MVNGDGEGSNVGGGARTSSEGGEDGQVVGGGGNRDVPVQGALCYGVEGVACACDRDKIGGGKETADGIQELWREG